MARVMCMSSRQSSHCKLTANFDSTLRFKARIVNLGLITYDIIFAVVLGVSILHNLQSEISQSLISCVR